MSLKQGLTNVGKDMLGSLLGNAETAYLKVDDYREACTPIEAAAGPLSGVASAVSAMNSIRQAAASALSAGVSPGMVPTGNKPKYFQVQFNPSDLQLDAAVPQARKLDAQVGKKGKKKTVADANQKPTITLSVSLLFDDTNLSDAFMFEKFTTGAGGTASLVTNIASAVLTATGKKWSVQPQVEALLAALRNNYTRFITFYWANFSFAGQLIAISAKYTMFSTSGRPIRATVNLRIRQELDPANLNNWYGEFTDSFGGGTSLTGAAQKVGNLLNLKL